MAEAREVRVQSTSNGWWQIVAGGEVVRSYRGTHGSGYVNAHRAAERLRDVAAVLDKHIPLRGQCLICGVPGIDQTHRIIEAIAGMARAEMMGEPENYDVSWVAEEFGYPHGGGELVDACLAWTAHSDRSTSRAPESRSGPVRKAGSDTTEGVDDRE